jgi:hypothetical protein
MACEIVPDLFYGVELWSIGGERLDMQPGVALLERGDRRSLVDRASIPEEDDMTPQMAPQGPHAARHGNGLAVVSLEAAIPPHRLARGGHREGRQGREAGMLVGVGDDRRLAFRGPRALAPGDKPTATFIQNSQVGPQAAGVF